LCEFKVYLGPQERQKLVAEEITTAKLDGNSLVLTDILGRTIKVQGALITGVDVKSESLLLYSAPFVSELLKLFVSFERWDRSSINQLESAWKALKTAGDEVINSLKSTREGAQA